MANSRAQGRGGAVSGKALPLDPAGWWVYQGLISKRRSEDYNMSIIMTAMMYSDNKKGSL